MAKIVVALGGNALGKDPKEQLEKVKIAAKNIVDLIELGHDIIVTHGNGPQVGMIHEAMEYTHKNSDFPLVPFAECGAMSQGYIGYHLEEAISTELRKRKIHREPVTIITEVVVDKNDLAFQNPTKPIGSFYTKAEASKLIKKGYQLKEDALRGYRRVVASPRPLKIIELDTISKLNDSGNIVIACGGGGVPIVQEKFTGVYRGIDAVIDKDKTSARLAIDLKADMLLILTTVPQVLLNYGKEDEYAVSKMTILETKKYIKEKQFAVGSMLPKVEACLEFVENSKGKAIITSLAEAKNALNGLNGTIIVKGGENNE
jgi:carbamate kinase